MKKQILALVSLMAVSASAAFAQTHVTGNITANTVWTTAGSPYVLEGVIYVTGNVTLDIAPGVVIRGQPKSTATTSDPGALIVTRGSKIQARGTFTTPIIFTTAALDAGLVAGTGRNGLRYDIDNDADRGNGTGTGADGVPDRWVPADGNAKWLDLDPAVNPLAPVNSVGERNSSLWGSLVLLGSAKINAATDLIPVGDGIKVDGRAYLEGLNNNANNEYGGENDDDSSGFLNYVSLRHGGYEITTGKELNGITLAGVGRNTTVRNVEIYCNSDDGIEIFGGTVNVSYACITFCEDDGYDLDQGYRGTSQFIYVAHGLRTGATFPVSADPRALEFDGDDNNEPGNPITVSGQPYQNSIVYNVTAQIQNNTGTPKIDGARVRRGFRGDIVNSLFQIDTGTGSTGINIDSSAPSVAQSPFVQQSYADRLINIRNNSFNGFATGSNTFTATPTLLSGFTPNLNVSTSYIPTTNAGTTAPVDPVAAVLYPATVNNTANPDLKSISYAANGLDPRPGSGPGVPSGLATGGVQDSAYVKFPAVYTTYKGAFNPAAVTLWTTGWTAVNKVNTAGVKLLVD